MWSLPCPIREKESRNGYKENFRALLYKENHGEKWNRPRLAVVWGTIKDHKRVYERREYRGERDHFYLYFPVTREDIASEQISVSMSEYMGSGETILIVDDINRQRELASRMLTKLNYTVSTVASGEEAIEHLKRTGGSDRSGHDHGAGDRRAGDV